MSERNAQAQAQSAGLNCRPFQNEDRLEALKEELDGIEETEAELRSISEHITALEDMLKGAKKPVCCIFLTLCAIIVIHDALESNFLNHFIRNLKKAGVKRKRLVFVPAKITGR